MTSFFQEIDNISNKHDEKNQANLLQNESNDEKK